MEGNSHMGGLLRRNTKAAREERDAGLDLFQAWADTLTVDTSGGATSLLPKYKLFVEGMGGTCSTTLMAFSKALPARFDS